MNDGDPLWKSCANWLYQLEILPDNHRILWPDATMRDLAYALRDGVLLCHVASTIFPGSIDNKSVNQRPQMAQFLSLKNIKIFLYSWYIFQFVQRLESVVQFSMLH